MRAKAGGRQSAKDGTGKAIKSAGSSLRRYNEAALDADIQGALTAWAPALSQCSLIFAHAPGQANAARKLGAIMVQRSMLQSSVVESSTR